MLIDYVNSLSELVRLFGHKASFVGTDRDELASLMLSETPSNQGLWFPLELFLIPLPRRPKKKRIKSAEPKEV